MTTYRQSIYFLEAFHQRPLIPTPEVGLDRAARLLDELDNPHRSFRCVHITGTAGKGSTATMTASILRAEGFRVGLFRSPHLESYTERIEVDGQPIREEAWTRCFDRVRPVVEAMTEGSLLGYNGGRPTLFDFLFAMAALHFASEGVDWAVLEAGMGGRLDATNLVESDVALITNVSLEHTTVLGDTVAKIAREKAAIIKQGGDAVTAARDEEALAVIRARAENVGARLWEVPGHVTAQILSEDLDGMTVDLRFAGECLQPRLRLTGRHQEFNAATAVTACLALRGRGVAVSSSSISRGLEEAVLPGRLEVLAGSSTILLDGAHNPASMEALAEAMIDLLKGARVVSLFAAMDDKDIERMALSLASISDHIVVTRVPGTERAASLSRETDAVRLAGRDPVVVADVQEALRVAERASREEKLPLLVCGSLYLVGAVRAALKEAVVA